MKLPSKKILIISTAAVVLLAGGLWALHQFKVITLPFLPREKAEDRGGINYGPPTEEEKQETDQFKEGLGNQSQTSGQQPPPAGQKRTASVFISSWGQPGGNGNVEVSGYVTGVYEEGGTCTATLEKDGQKVSGSRAAAINAQNISCGFITIERSRLVAGTYKVILSYASAAAEGTSQPVTLEVK